MKQIYKSFQIFFEDQVQPIKCILKNHLCWFSFSIVHKIEDMNVNRLKAILSSTLTFEVSQGSNNIIDKYVNNFFF